ncbi:MAG: hypothetical protein Fur0043_13470 [Anaerolineales bacterium]
MSINLLTPLQTKNHPKRFSHVQAMSAQAAQAEARRILQTGLSAHVEYTLTLLYSAGILPACRFLVDERTLRKYHKLRLLDRLPYLSSEIQDAYHTYGLPLPSGSMLLYTLGPVGHEIVKERFGFTAPGGYLNMPLTRLMHDLTVNEIIYRLAELVRDNTTVFRWVSKYEATLWKDNQAILEPDALFVIQQDGQQKAYALEYHNEENKRYRAEEKVLQYEKAFQSGLWTRQWEVDTFPQVLAVYRDKSVGQGYHDQINAYADKKVRLYGRSLEGFFQDPTTWYDFQRREKTRIFSK